MIKAKKSLGQNFLNDIAIVRRIVECANVSQNDFVIEIGPGKGMMTEWIAENAAKVIAIELDDRLIPILQKKFLHVENVQIIHGDILKINLPELIENQLKANEASETKNLPAACLSRRQGYKVVANIPYYITAPIIRTLLETKYPPEEIILMVQKEVAERIAAIPGEMSILSVSVQYYANAEVLFEVPATAFDPVPQVDSSVIRIVRKKQDIFDKEETKNFFKIVRIGFSAKRKTLANNLSNGLHIKKIVIENELEKNSFSKNIRAQELSVEDWKKLANIFG